MGTDLQQSRQLLQAEGLTLAIVKGDQRWTSKQHGIAALLELVEDPGVDLRDASAADLVIGKAAALLYAQAGVTSLWAGLLSDTGAAVLAEHGIAVEAVERTDFIRNRAGDGMCPMEAAAQQIDTPAEAAARLRAAIERLRQGRQEAGR